MTTNFNGAFLFAWRNVSMHCLSKAPIVSFQHFILSIPTYRHINVQWFPHFSILVPIFNWDSFGMQPVEMAVTFLCVFGCLRRWPITFDALLLMLLWRTLLLMFCSWFSLFHHNILTSMEILICTLQGDYLVLIYLFLHKIFFWWGPVWNAILFLIFGLTFGIQGEITVFLPLLLLLLLLILRVFFSKLLISFALLFDHIHFVKHISQIFYFHPQIFFWTDLGSSC